MKDKSIDGPVTLADKVRAAKLAKHAPALVEALQEAIDALEGKVSNLDDVICCSGHDCGCLGSSHRDLLVHNIHAVLSTALGEMNDA